jgi:ribosomal protein L6P/L9E
MSKIRMSEIISSTSIKNINNLKILYIKQNKFFIFNDKKNNIKYLNIPDNIYIYKTNNHIKLLSLNKKSNINFFIYKLLNWIKNQNKVYRKILRLKGLGLKMSFSEDKQNIYFKLGFSHIINIGIPKKLKINIKKNRISIISKNLAFLSNFAKKLKQMKTYNRYNGRGFSYKRELKKYKTFKKK